MATATATAAELQQIKSVAATNGVSWQTLLGVFGTESGYGSNDGPSSAGAEGPFQFEPSTGDTYGLTPTTIWQFGPSLDAAAKYLKSLGATTSPTSAQTFNALNRYNGNDAGPVPTGYTNSVLSYGLSSKQFLAQEKTAMANVNGPGLNLPADVKTGADAVANVYNTIAGILGALTSPKTWVAVGIGVLGLGIILVAVHRSTGLSVPRP